ncbi:unnamed protein product [Peronospora farinosa]|uniref:SAYSvFN domain-containing protein n=1 Tax=Peronospora farinosa TaxID=134698 RepID=A0AAV0T3E9_9STRA|nr:unnamed protein product [Peronospora farinosa]CAI5713964.1 unnamed protein product [Peronospora farinosa]
MANAPRMRRVRATDQGPLDWLVPFIPPVLRVNRETRAEICRKVANLLSKETMESIVLALRPHWRSLAVFLLGTAIWMKGLVYIHYNETEFAVAYVILSGFVVLGYHLLVGGEGYTGDMSAYSVFNRGAQRMLGSLSAEQFENEIRHRQVEHEDIPRPEALLAAHDLGVHDEVENEDDPDLIMALELSLQEMKREDRQNRRTTRRK